MRRVSKFALAFFSCLSVLGTPVQAEVVREDTAESLLNRKTPVYVWQDNNQKPRAVAIAIHGLVMHGGVYNALANKLASEGMIVMAPDLRGFGRWQSKHSKDAQLDYDKSLQDIDELVKAARARYPDLPLYCIGESMGAGLAMHTAINNPQIVDGLVLSAPALKPRIYMGPLISETLKPQKQVKLEPYIRKWASEDPRIVEESLADPLVTKRLTAWQIMKSIHYMRPNLGYAKKLPSNIPFLVMQGDQDRILKSNAVVKLISNAKTKDQTVRWFNNRGHLLLETAFIPPDTINTVNNWLQTHIEEASQSQPTTIVSLNAESQLADTQTSKTN
ncbi:MAG: alpha/beta fold hydrolase [Candidatus Obscuribacterales bacterium]